MPPPADRNPRSAGALNALLEVTVLLGEDMDGDLRRRGLTRSRTEVLWRVHAAGPITQRELADALGVSARTITGLVDGLEQTGFAERRPHPTDRRAFHVALTAKGARTATALQRDFTELADQLFGSLTDTELDALGDQLQRLATRLRELIAQ